MAEKMLSLIVVKCRYKCKKEMKFCEREDHELNVCELKPVVCKYMILGCKWSGIKKYQMQHEEKCKIDQKYSYKIISLLNNKLKCFETYCLLCKYFYFESVWICPTDVLSFNSKIFNYRKNKFKVEMKAEIDKDSYNLFVKIVYVEIEDENEEEFENKDMCYGIYIEPHGNEHSNFLCRGIVQRDNYSGTVDIPIWIIIGQDIKKKDYINMFLGGFDLRVFLFGWCHEEPSVSYEINIY